MIAISLLCACTGRLPGGSDTVNKAFYDSDENLKMWVESLEPGMSKGEVFARLGRTQEDFTRLTRTQIIAVLFGGTEAGIPPTYRTEDIKAFLESLEGYKLDFKNVKKRHGFSSPIRVQTDAKGFEYSLNLVFRNGLLFEKPVLTGGAVNQSSSKTLFDYLNPGVLMRVVE